MEIRWKQRFENYERALRLLREALEEMNNLTALEKEGTIQRFEFTVELAWKTLKDYLESSGIVMVSYTPKEIVKQAFAAKIIRDGQKWIDILDCRNRLSHIYDEAVFDEALRDVSEQFLPEFEELYMFLKKEAVG
ncbi:MAG TPA: nucleotidyltransferase substrate binding protein [Candidatus Kapabacteria bacterium]